MSLLASHTLVIPTFNRPGMLKTLLTFLAPSRLNIIVLDSSDGPTKRVNCRTVNGFSHIVYKQFDSDIHPYAKILDGICNIATPYVSICGDDDVVFPDAISKSIDMLEKCPEAAAAHGIYVVFEYSRKVPYSLSIDLEYDGPSLESEAPLRLLALLSRYESPFYAVYRSSMLRQMWERMLPLEGYLFKELFQATATVLSGSMLRIPEIYGARRSGAWSDPNRQKWEPLGWVRDDFADFFRAYVHYRDALLNWWETQDAIVPREQKEKWCDASHYMYLATHLSPRTFKHDVLGFPLPSLRSRLADVMRNTADFGWDRPIYVFMKTVRKIANKMMKLLEHRAEVRRCSNLMLSSEIPIEVGERWRKRPVPATFGKVAALLSEYVKADIANLGLAAEALKAA